jgi:hypothetical protein
MTLQKIVSGGQTGADFAGLLAGRHLGLETGGTAPSGWRICLPDGSDGSNPDLADFGLVEDSSRDYPPRTRMNVFDSDGTVWFGYTQSSGARLTIRSCHDRGKPVIVNPTAAELKEWVERFHVQALNVAGNRASDLNPDIQQTTFSTLVEAFS